MTSQGSSRSKKNRTPVLIDHRNPTPLRSSDSSVQLQSKNIDLDKSGEICLNSQTNDKNSDIYSSKFNKSIKSDDKSQTQAEQIGYRTKSQESVKKSSHSRSTQKRSKKSHQSAKSSHSKASKQSKTEKIENTSIENALLSGGFKSVATENVQPVEKLLENSLDVVEGTMQDKISENLQMEDQQSVDIFTEKPNEPLKVLDY